MTPGSLSVSVRSAATKSSRGPCSPDSGDRARSPWSRTATSARRRPFERIENVPSHKARRTRHQPDRHALLRQDLTCSETFRTVPSSARRADPENGFRRQVAHAPMMTFRADRPLARSARYPMKYMPRMRMVGAGPGDVRRSEQRDDRRLKGRREMARARVGRDQERRPADAGLGESDTERLIGQADHVRVAGRGHDFPRRLAFVGPAEDQDRHAGLVGQSPRQLGEVRHGPALGRTKCSARVQADDPPLAAQSQAKRRPGRPRLRPRPSWPARSGPNRPCSRRSRASFR